jgi:PAS domain S-box-containing protein
MATPPSSPSDPDREAPTRDAILALAEDSGGIGVWDHDLATGLVRGTPQFFRLLGLEPSAEPVPQDRIRQLRHPEDAARVVQGFRRALGKGKSRYEIEYRIVRPDGQVRWIFGRGRVIRDANGVPVRYSGIDIDITDRKIAEAALADSQERLRLAQEAAGIGSWDWDLTTSAVRWSDSEWRLYGEASKSTGLSFDEWMQFIHPDDRGRLKAAIGQAVATKGRFEAEYRVCRPDDAVKWLASRGTVVADDAGRPVRILGIDVDVTDRRDAADALVRMNQLLEQRIRERTVELEAEAKRRTDAEARLHQAQKMEAVGQLTGGIAHDFNNLLTVVIGNLHMLKRRLAQPMAEQSGDKLLRSVEHALQGANAAAQLTHRLLAFSRQNPLTPTSVDVNTLVTGMSEMIRRTLSETIIVETRLSEGLWPIFVDANQLETALLNLIVNARDAMPAGGMLTITTGNLDSAMAVTELAPGQYVALSVSDSGTGIAREVLDKVFEPFFTTKETGKGSGLGLSMVYGFVRQSGGQVTIDSAPGAGTVVTLYLPRQMQRVASHPPTAQPLAVAESVPRALPQETILFVEDNELVGRYATEALESLGYAVLTVASGDAALRLLDNTSQRIDLLFTDMVLPGAMSGRALADHVLAQRPGTGVLFTTGYSREDEVVQNQGLLLLRKPFSLENLASKVRQAIDLARTSGNVVAFRPAGHGLS